MESSIKSPHPNGESSECPASKNLLSENLKLAVDTYGGRVHVEWDPHAAVTPLGQLAFFIEYLKLGGLFDSWVDDCPLEYTSPNAPSKRDILGTLLLSVLAGHTRYSHITTIRCDGVNPNLLGMNKIISEDAVRRALLNLSALAEHTKWLQTHLSKCYIPLLSVPWVLDIDTTVKCLYGKQEGAEIGYNPRKPGRPSHCYHSYFIGNLRLVLDVEVQAGNQTSANNSTPHLWSMLEQLPKDKWPEFIRGDCGFGNDSVMSDAEEIGIPYLFKLKITKNVKLLIETLMLGDDWEDAGQGWEGRESSLQLMGWKKYRRVVVLRRRLSSKNVLVVDENSTNKQLEFNFGTLAARKPMYEYAVLVTTLSDEILTLSQHYRDRADCENIFDELKNQWGWGGFTTRDLGRCHILARTIALVYNWWNIFVRLAKPDKHLEAITSRPLLLHSVGKQITHAGQTCISISSSHGKIDKVKTLLNSVWRETSKILKFRFLVIPIG